ncbi:squalene--hopene cyclase [Paenibacillus glucanolyticus]|uniref:Squalene--hopene cyclase n=1 Tax=Paenibacillus glucanolyticus TaxID=59843 RepID=A0A163JXH4_9BACL|nr:MULTISPECIES: DinB family protein [Paenibacillus]AWP29681.1 squalene--hopene cyclase [Paenibacillus sp. Cedars]KZS46855.1 squalene--hopene cyclase [Paenibacillus glucanolyticus]
MNTRPDSHEYLPLAEPYVSLVPEGSITEILQQQHDETLKSLSDLTEEQANYKYAEGKWSLKQVVGHIADVERLWNYRILYIARGDAREFSGYDREIFVRNSPFGSLPLREALKDYAAVRQSSITLIGSLTEEALLREGTFNNYPLSARAAAYVIAGHELHHLNILRDKYLT